MKWFFCFNEHAAGWFADMIRVAVVTAGAYAPELEPHCLFDGHSDNDLTLWLRDRGVTVHRAEAPNKARFGAADIIQRNAGTPYSADLAGGYYLYLSIPDHEAVKGDEFVLVTDCDVQFTGPVSPVDLPRPRLLAAAPEIDLSCLRSDIPFDKIEGFNAGVLVLNLPAMRARLSKILAIMETHGYYCYGTSGAIYDQPALNLAITKGEWDVLPMKYNWRPFLQMNPDARIVHWHGPKPSHVGSDAPNATMQQLLAAAPDAYLHYRSLFDAALAEARS